MSDTHQRIRDAVSAFARGEILLVADDDDRENEGDLFVAASLCTPEKMAFIIRNTSGIVCAPLAQEEARRLHLEPMVARNDAPLARSESFTASSSTWAGRISKATPTFRSTRARTSLADARINVTSRSPAVRPGD